MTACTDDSAAVRAVNQRRLASWAETAHGDDEDDPQPGESTHEFARQAIATCRTIGAAVDAECASIAALLAAAGVDTSFDVGDSLRQRHEATATVASFDHADQAAALLEPLGFHRWITWRGGAAESFRRTARELTVARTDGVSFVIRFRWRVDEPRPRWARHITPTAGDWSMVDLPPRIWWAYSAIRPFRQLAERLGRRDPLDAGLGPFLSTPESLISPLLDVVDLGADDVLVDIGCGDGRLVAAAARTLGCRAIGIERDRTLVERGRRRLADDEVTDRARIEHGDARATDLSEVTVAFMFLPMHVVAELVPETLARLPVGARLIVHEQTALPSKLSVAPDRSTAIVTADAVTVAHRWTRQSG